MEKIYVKKPIPVKAKKFKVGTEDYSDCLSSFACYKSKELCKGCGYLRTYIHTQDGKISIDEGDYILTDIGGVKTRVKKHIFESVYTEYNPECPLLIFSKNELKRILTKNLEEIEMPEGENKLNESLILEIVNKVILNIDKKK